MRWNAANAACCIAEVLRSGNVGVVYKVFPMQIENTFNSVIALKQNRPAFGLNKGREQLYEDLFSLGFSPS